MLIGLAVLSGGTLGAQESDQGIYLDEDYPEPRRWSFGLAVGLVELGDNVIEGQQIVSDDDVETYFAASLRIPFGDRRAHDGPARRGFRSYLEPEVGYWDGDAGSDFLLGLNIVGAVPYNSVEFFIGGGVGIHFLDQPLDSVVIEDFSDEALGVNAHFGVDVSISEMVAFYGVGRFDVVDGDRDELEGKAYLGIRFRF
jgi:hypothetical protein